MTDPSANRKIPLALGIQSGLETVDYYPGFALGNSQLFPGPPESLEPDRFSCCPRDPMSHYLYIVARTNYNLQSMMLGQLIFKA